MYLMYLEYNQNLHVYVWAEDEKIENFTRTRVEENISEY